MRMIKTAELFILSLIVSVPLLYQLTAAESDARVWETADGKFKVTAALKQYNEKEKTAVLVKKDGKEVTVPVEKLSKNDQDFLKNSASNPPAGQKIGKDDTGKVNSEKAIPAQKQLEPVTKDAKQGVSHTLSADDEQVAKKLCSEFKTSIVASKKPKWEAVWSIPLKTPFTDIDFSKDPDYAVITTPYYDDSVKAKCTVINLKDGTEVKASDDELCGKLFKTAISPDGKFVLNATLDQGLVLWDITTAKKVFKIEGPKEPVQDIRFSIEGGKVAVLDADSVLHVYPLMSNDGLHIELDKEIHTPTKEEAASKTSRGSGQISISPDGKNYAVWQPGKKIYYSINLESCIQKKERAAARYITTVAGSAGALATNQMYMRLADDGVMEVWTTRTPEPTGKVSMRTDHSSIKSSFVKSINSWDGKWCATYDDKAVLFCSPTLQITETASPPELKNPKSKSRQFWLLPDMHRVLQVEQVDRKHRTLTLYRAVNALPIDKPDYCETIRDLVAKGKYDVLNRAYLMLDRDPFIIESSLIRSNCDVFLNSVETAHFVQSPFRGDRLTKPLEDWMEGNPDATIAQVLFARKAIREAWAARGRGYAATVTPEGWKVFSEKMAQAKKLVEPQMSNEHIPMDILDIWFDICMATGWNDEDVKPAIEKLIADCPLNKSVHTTIAFALLPRWHGEEGDSLKYCEKIADIVDKKYSDALYAVSARVLLAPDKTNFPPPRFDFDIKKYPVKTYDNIRLDSKRMLSGAEQLAKLIPDSAAGASLGLFLSAKYCDIESAKKFLKMIDENHDGKPSPSFMLDWQLDVYRKCIKEYDE